jgi:AAA+ ATPase superfamily predicted ATPase
MLVYGRRRIGKTVLLRHWIEKHLGAGHLLWTAYRTTSEILLTSFSESVARLTPEVSLYRRTTRCRRQSESLTKPEAALPSLLLHVQFATVHKRERSQQRYFEGKRPIARTYCARSKAHGSGQFS